MKKQITITLPAEQVEQLKKNSHETNTPVSGIVSDLISLGWVNNWDSTPEKIRACSHELKREKIGRCMNRYFCDVCKYEYHIDSTD